MQSTNLKCLTLMRFFVYLKGFFTGTSKTFFRQLSYFRFERRELLPKGFSFAHEHFRNDDVQQLVLMKRAVSSRSLLSDEEDTNSASDANNYQRLEEMILILGNQVQDLTQTVTGISQELKRYNDDNNLPGKLYKRGHLVRTQEEDLEKLQFDYFDDFESLSEDTS